MHQKGRRLLSTSGRDNVGQCVCVQMSGVRSAWSLCVICMLCPEWLSIPIYMWYLALWYFWGTQAFGQTGFIGANYLGLVCGVTICEIDQGFPGVSVCLYFVGDPTCDLLLDKRGHGSQDLPEYVPLTQGWWGGHLSWIQQQWFELIGTPKNNMAATGIIFIDITNIVHTVVILQINIILTSVVKGMFALV